MLFFITVVLVIRKRIRFDRVRSFFMFALKRQCAKENLRALPFLWEILQLSRIPTRINNSK